MSHDPIPGLLQQVDQEMIRRHLFFLAADPLPYRKVNYTLPGHSKSTLDEADDYIQAQLESWGYAVEREGCPVQAFRRDRSKPITAQYSPPHADDPWYTAYNLYARRPGRVQPEETIVVVSHKDSQSWIDSPGAYDNAIGTAANLEIARVLSQYEPARTICFLYCNEEHTPWTSVTAARRARERGDRIVAVLNIDAVGGKPQAEIDAGRKTNVTVYVGPEGERLAALMAEVNRAYGIGLEQSSFHTPTPGDDHGSFIKEGFLAAVANIGSYPYADPFYHQEGDTAARVDLANVLLATQASLGTVVRLAG